MRFRVLDFYRFCAAALVMAYHFIPMFKANYGNFNLCVDFFFMLSGFVIAETYENRVATWAQYADFLVRRLARIYPLHIATMLIYASAAFAISGGLLRANHASEFNGDGLLQNILLVHAWHTTSGLSLNTPSWSISAEWALYLGFPLILTIRRHGGEFALPLAAAALILAYELLTLFGQPPNIAWTEMSFDYGALRAIPSFLIGAWLAGRVERDRLAMRALPAGVALFFVALAMIYLGAPRFSILAIFAAALYATACGERNGETSILQGAAFGALGDASYAIYLLHPLVLTGSAQVLKPLVGDGPMKIALAMALTGALAIVCHRKFERPMQGWILRWWRKEQSTLPVLAVAR